MRIALVMTVIGRDRPGLVGRLSQLVADHDGNWLESRMCRLGGEFAGILQVSLPAKNERSLAAALEKLAEEGLQVVVREDQPLVATARQVIRIEVVGQDRPGIVREISATLASEKVNVEELETECSSAPMSGEPLFRARARLTIPESCDPEQLRRNLERIAADLLVDISFETLTDAA